MPGTNINQIDFRSLFESVPGLYLVLQTDFTIIAVSDAYLKSTMTSRGTILDRNIFEVFPDNPEDPQATGVKNLKASLESVLKNRIPHTMAMQKYDIRRPQCGGFEERFWSPVNSPVFDECGNIRYIIHRVEDMTEFVRLKQQGREQNELTKELQNRTEQMELEIFLRSNEIQERTKQLEAANQELERLNRNLLITRDQAIEASNLKSAFVANISHELRTPLAGVLGLNELMLATDLTCEQEELALSIHDSAHALLSILNDILDLSKIEAGKALVESLPFNAISVVQDVSHLLSSTATQKGLDLETFIDKKIPPVVVGDPVRIRQILINLLGNSIKFTDAGEIKVSAILESDDSEQVTLKFSVADTGIGISDANQRLLFEPFSQVDSSDNRKYGGTGLGLSISKRLVTLMGGEIGVESLIGQGSTFWFRVPFGSNAWSRTPESSRSVRKSAISPIPGNKMVLVAEDSPILQQLLAKQMTNLGVQVFMTSTGREAIEALRTSDFEIVFMDCQMPDIDGFEATRIIREREKGTFNHCIIIAMTAAVMKGDAEKCLTAGMDDYLSKPFSLEQLHAKVDKWIKVVAERGSGSSCSSNIPVDSDCPVDFGMLNTRYQDPQLIQRMLRMFIDDGARQIEEMRHAVLVTDTTNLLQATHRLKGVCATLFVWEMHEVCNSIESAASEQDWQSLSKLLERLTKNFAYVQRWVNAHP